MKMCEIQQKQCLEENLQHLVHTVEKKKNLNQSSKFPPQETIIEMKSNMT